MKHEAGRPLPKPMTDLIVEGRVFVRGKYASVIAQAVMKLRTIQSMVYGLRAIRSTGSFHSGLLALGLMSTGACLYAHQAA